LGKARKEPDIAAFSLPEEKIFARKCRETKNMSIFAVPNGRFFRAECTGEMPEWSIGPHSKCGVRATVPGVRIPLSPQQRLIINQLQKKRTVLRT
jgi:hypothetical protein